MAGKARRRRAECASEARTALCHAPAGGPRALGAVFERRARRYLEQAGLGFVAANVAVRGGELDLVMRAPDGMLVFVEVRARADASHGGAAASIGWDKRRRILRAALRVWARDGGRCACRFDVVAFEGTELVWIPDAFRADGV